MKKFLVVISILFVSLFLVSCKKDKEKDENESRDLIINKTETIKAKTLWSVLEVKDNVRLDGDYIVKDKANKFASIETKEIKINNFKELVMTWNVLVDDESILSFSIAVGDDEGFSNYFIMGLWQKNSKSSFVNDQDDYARVSIDTLIAKKEINKIKIKVDFNESNSENTKLKNISITTKVDDKLTLDKTGLIEKNINVSPRQQLSIPKIGNLICSPTSVSMVLDYYGETLETTDVAENVFDRTSKIYGNWTLNASYAGGFENINSRVEYIDDFGKIVEYIKNDIPVILSIRTTSKEELEGTIMPYASGHLLVLKGFKKVNDVWYGIVNDPAEYEDSKVERLYDLDQLTKAWRGYTYIIYK